MLVGAILGFSSCNTTANYNAGNKPANTTTVNTTTSTTTTDADVRKLLSDLEAAVSKNDAAALDKIYSDDYTFIGPDGKFYTKAQRLDSIRSGDTKAESIKFDDVKVQSYGDTAVVTTNVALKGKMQGKDVNGTGESTIVFSKVSGNWRVVHGHASVSGPTTKTAANSNTAAANKTTSPTNKAASSTNKTTEANKATPSPSNK